MKAVKWIGIGAAALVVVVIGALLVIPMFVDVQKFKPEIEKQVSNATGCAFSIGGDLKLSLFPLAGVAFSDLHLGNPPGFTEKDMLFVKSFDVKVKLMPLLSKEIQVNRFLVDGLRLTLEKGKDGRANWEVLGKARAKPTPETKAPAAEPPAAGKPAEPLPIKSLAVGELAVRNAALLWVDGTKGQRKEVSDLDLEIKDISLERPIQLLFAANVDGHPLKVEGKMGPLGKQFGNGPIPLDLSIKAFSEINATLKGSINGSQSQPGLDMALDVASFSPRKLAETLKQPFPATMADPTALSRVGLKAKLKGNPQSASLTDGTVELDATKIAFSATAKDFDKPDLRLNMDIDQIDVDRYLPPPGQTKASADRAAPAPAARKKTDYGPLRKMVLDGEVKVGKAKVMGAQIQNMVLNVKGRGGVFQVDPFQLQAYQGSVKSKANLDLRADSPKMAVDLDTTGVQVRPLMTELMKKDFLEGTTQAKIALKMEGDSPEQIKKTLNGAGELRFTDGAIIGIDLAGMVRNAKAAFGLGEKPAEKPRTDFSELTAPFTVKNGLVHTPGTSLASPLLRVVATGNADLVAETLDMRVEPKIVATIKGQGDTKERSGLMVPVLVTGTFAAPRFAPDLKGILDQTLKEGLPSVESIKDKLKGTGTPTDATAPRPTPADKAKSLLKGLPLGK